MASAAGVLFPQIANYNPQGFVQGNELQQQNIGLTAAQAARQQAEVPLVQQQAQGEALKNQLTQQSIQDSRILRDAYAEHADADWSDPQTQASLEKDLVKNGISYQGLAGYRAQALKWQQDLQGLDENRLKIEDTVNQRTADILQGYKDIPDAQKPQIWAQVTAPALNGLHRGQFDATNPLVGSALDSVIGTVAHHKQLVEDAKNIQETKTSAATAAEAGARTESEKQKTELTKREIALHDQLVNNPGGLERYVAGSIDPQQFPQEYKAAVNEARMQPDIKGIDAVVSRHSENVSHQVSQKALETDPEILAAKRKQEETLANYRNALEQGDKAKTEYFGSLKDLNETLGNAKTIEQIVQLARSGNPISSEQLQRIVPQFTNAMQGIKARSGYENDKGFTSVRDRAVNMFESAIAGRPLDASSLDQIMPYVRTIANGATERHNQAVNSIRQGYGQSHPQEPVPYPNTANAGTAQGRPTGAPARKIGDKVTLRGGKTVTVTKVYPDGSFDY